MKLSGTPVGTTSVDYGNGAETTTVNTPAEAFDGDFNTCFAAYQRSFGWVGLELDKPYVITRVGWAARNDGLGPGRMELGVFQGANKPDFSDALPIYLIPEKGRIGEMMYADVKCSKGFRYVRYVGPHDARCNVGELEFYGIPGEGDDSALYQVTNLPTVVVNTPGMEWFHEDDKSYGLEGSLITVIDGGKIDVSASGQIRGRGNSSWTFPKKPFRIKFDKKQKVLGGPAKAKKWTMINNYGDKTLMRNKLAFEISRRFEMPFTPACHFVDCIFNGEYQGCYQLCDQVEVKEGRVNVTEMEPTDTDGLALTGGYLLEIDAYADQEAPDEWFTSGGALRIPVTIKSPDPGVQAQYNFIRNRFTMLENAVMASNYTDPDKGYRRLLDLDSFLKHFIINELAGNTDTYWSTYMSLERGESKFNVGPVWDFDLGFDNDTRTYPVNNKADFICYSGSFANGMWDFTRRIIKQDQGARERMKYLWSYARNTNGITADDLTALVNQYATELEASQRLNFKRWPIMNEYVHQNPRVWGSYAAEVQNVRNYITNRVNRLDQLIGYDPTISAIDAIGSAGSASVKAGQGSISISGASGYTIHNIQGISVATGRGDATVSVAPGAYIVIADGHAVKLLVK